MSAAGLAIVYAPLSCDLVVAALERQARQVGEGCGAICTFAGIVRGTHTGRAVRFLEYEAHERLAVNVFQLIATEAAEHWPLSRLAIHHRVGRLLVGETSVLVAAAAAHRAESFQVCRYAIERVKQVAPIWKHEFFQDGERWVEGALADPANPLARQEALQRACT
ncbi:MAG: molybdenum cofactor biosynthesis protein MoaE [Vicinamibacterales bacterium]